MQNFQEAALPQPLFHRLEQIGFTTPTPIQAESIPPALLGRDILGSAQTGTGKTGAYGIPLVAKLLTSNRGSALILLPTRELATQVMQALQKFIGKSRVSKALLIGGEPMGPQFSQLRTKPRLIVGTPGRVNDHLKRGTLMLHDTNFLVLDEVDRMLDLGFGVQLDEIARFLTAKRQTLMFSATLPDNIQKLSSKYLKDPVRISVGASHVPADNIKQEFIKVSDSNKYDRLVEELNKRTGSVVIFVKTKSLADTLARKLKKSGHKADALHGDLRQSRRAQVTAAFRSQKYRILVATDVAARGLDVPHIEHVINHDLPQNPEDFIHRIGRTARAGADGEALTFLSPADNVKWREIQLLLNPDKKPDNIGGNSNNSKRNNNRRNSVKKNQKPYVKSGARKDSPKKKAYVAKGDGSRSGGGQEEANNQSSSKKKFYTKARRSKVGGEGNKDGFQGLKKKNISSNGGRSQENDGSLKKRGNSAKTSYGKKKVA